MDTSTEAMQKVFNQFDSEKTGFMTVNKFPDVMKELGAPYDEEELKSRIEEIDEQGSGKVNFRNFMKIVMPFMAEESDEAMYDELREAFRMYDKAGDGYITTQVLKEILKELDPKLTGDELESIVDEVDDDKSGTVDFEEFMKMMMG